MPEDDLLERVVASIRQKTKYATICPKFIERIVAQEILKRKSVKEAEKFSRSKLHQMAGAYLENRPNWKDWEIELGNLPHQVKTSQVKEFCRLKMESHASTRERIPILESFFSQTLASLAPIHSILDLGCGINILSLAWMPLADDPIYQGLDIFQDMLDFSTKFLQHFLLRGCMQCTDILTSLPKQRAQLGLILKVLPVLEQLDKNSVQSWLEKIPAEHLLVSYPVASLGGKGKGMKSHYHDQFNLLLTRLGWQAERFDFSSEIAYLIHRNP